MTLQLSVPNMACSACGETITAAIKSTDPNAIVTPDLRTKLINIETQASETSVKQAVTDAGYSVT
ncbi:MAG: heavy-metal-associated domain-containing protein [Leptolyngbya sp. Prado105]|jgi:copper chaperone|nr:heavy-metal-associated domain-containing protein [Leptolyngbya sp. Prado105]